MVCYLLGVIKKKRLAEAIEKISLKYSFKKNFGRKLDNKAEEAHIVHTNCPKIFILALYRSIN